MLWLIGEVSIVGIVQCDLIRWRVVQFRRHGVFPDGLKEKADQLPQTCIVQAMDWCYETFTREYDGY